MKTMIILTINGKKQQFDKAPSLQECLEIRGMGGMMVAMARNGTFVPRSAYPSTVLADGDEIEIVAPMQGG